MESIDQQQFRTLCDQVRELAPSILKGLTSQSEKTDRILWALFERVCTHLGLDPVEQHSTIQGDTGFGLLQTLEEHMNPEFLYSAIMDEDLLMQI